jgi:hypothetical protein
MRARSPRLWTTTIGVSLLGVAIAMGCAPTLLDENWGLSFRETTDGMIANPEAGTTEAAPIEGLDPLTSELVIENYKTKKGEPQLEPQEIFIVPQE